MGEVSEEEIIMFLKSKRESLKQELEKVEVALNAITGTDFSTANYSFTPTIDKEIPNSYSSKLKMDKKILYALNEIKSGDKQDILNHLQVLEPKIELKKIEKSISVRLSHLKNNNIIKSDKNGRSLTYFL
ncbi:hypothetical protein MM236_15460 [Belliella sp. DSM 107340]|uniref:HTH arsR-type domain-containing protein n=1 Tax=Belliella calami TaxID=2923436 RepID=A0ABS9USJ4_9BACT|nr:hypothetical protein [Belliella calami]MCH7399399.1 hypothetical protein [Belliella calami]